MRVLCVHQGYELYGSDRSFISAVAVLRRMLPAADIQTMVPAEGPIVPLLAEHSTSVRVEPLWILRRRYLPRLVATGLFSLPVSVIRAILQFRKSDFVYINTLTVLDYLLVAPLFHRKALLHVREIPTGAGGYAIRSLVRSARVPVIFNSNATRAAFGPSDQTPTYVLHNGYEGPSSYDLPEYTGDRPLRVLMLGRLNSWKGQDLLIEACSLLAPQVRSGLDIRIVGSSFESNTALEQNLHRLVKESGCSECVKFEPFANEPGPWYRWCDLVVVPSRLPEPFGRVPVEAMSFARGAIVAAFGGLVETVEDGVTGWHVPPNNPAALAKALVRVIGEPRWVQEFGRNARTRYELTFRQDIVDKKFIDIVRERLARAVP